MTAKLLFSDFTVDVEESSSDTIFLMMVGNFESTGVFRPNLKNTSLLAQA